MIRGIENKSKYEQGLIVKNKWLLSEKSLQV